MRINFKLPINNDKDEKSKKQLIKLIVEDFIRYRQGKR